MLARASSFLFTGNNASYKHVLTLRKVREASWAFRGALWNGDGLWRKVQTSDEIPQMKTSRARALVRYQLAVVTRRNFHERSDLCPASDPRPAIGWATEACTTSPTWLTAARERGKKKKSLTPPYTRLNPTLKQHIYTLIYVMCSGMLILICWLGLWCHRRSIIIPPVIMLAWQICAQTSHAYEHRKTIHLTRLKKPVLVLFYSILMNT